MDLTADLNDCAIPIAHGNAGDVATWRRGDVARPHGHSFEGADSLGSPPDDKGPPSPAIGAAGMPACGEVSLSNSSCNS